MGVNFKLKFYSFLNASLILSTLRKRRVSNVIQNKPLTINKTSTIPIVENDIPVFGLINEGNIAMIAVIMNKVRIIGYNFIVPTLLIFMFSIFLITLS